MSVSKQKHKPRRKGLNHFNGQDNQKKHGSKNKKNYIVDDVGEFIGASGISSSLKKSGQKWRLCDAAESDLDNAVVVAGEILLRPNFLCAARLIKLV